MKINFISCSLQRVLGALILFATIETSGSLGRVWLYKVFWGRYRKRENLSSKKNMEKSHLAEIGEVRPL